MTHTPGPWDIFWNYNGSGKHRIYVGGSADITEMVADVNEFAPTDGDMEAEGKANARLIANAPRLLDELKTLIAAIEYETHPIIADGDNAHRRAIVLMKCGARAREWLLQKKL